MNSCKVFVLNDSLSRDDVTFSAKPKGQLRAVPYGATSKQIVKNASNPSHDLFAIFDAGSVPCDITGMALFITVSKAGEVVADVKGKVNSDIKGMVAFKVDDLQAGFYSYEISARAANDYYQSLLGGSYVVQP